jgi:hypothetical protein
VFKIRSDHVWSIDFWQSCKGNLEGKKKKKRFSTELDQLDNHGGGEGKTLTYTSYNMQQLTQKVSQD